ncbi:MAG TPA: ABC transporter permease [Acidimicrobiia bacterium]|jgi:ABC-2 type transport system permease protein
MSDAGLTLRQTAYGVTGFRRNARAVVFTVLMPIILLVLFASVFTGHTQTTKAAGLPLSIDAYFTAGITAYAITLAGFSSLMVAVVTARERGLLKRYRGTPMPSWVFLTAQILQSLVVVVLMSAVLLAIGLAAYDVHLSSRGALAFALYVVIGAATMCALGLAMSRVATTVDAASAIGPFTVVILGFVSGVFIPAEQLPSWLVDVGRVFPLSHLAVGLQRAFSPALSGSGIDAGNLAVLALWGLAGIVIALRSFQWEPLGASS